MKLFFIRMVPIDTDAGLSVTLMKAHISSGSLEVFSSLESKFTYKNMRYRGFRFGCKRAAFM